MEEAAAANAQPMTVWNNSHQSVAFSLDFVATIKPTIAVTITNKLSLALVSDNRSFLVNSDFFLSLVVLYEEELPTINYNTTIWK